MRGRTILKKDGQIVVEVLDREGSDCREVHKLTQHVGTAVREEVTGPDCDTAHETSIDQ